MRSLNYTGQSTSYGRNAGYRILPFVVMLDFFKPSKRPHSMEECGVTRKDVRRYADFTDLRSFVFPVFLDIGIFLQHPYHIFLLISTFENVNKRKTELHDIVLLTDHQIRQITPEGCLGDTTATQQFTVHVACTL